MIVRNLSDAAVLETTYVAHGGAIAQMILDRRILKEKGNDHRKFVELLIQTFYGCK